MRHARLPTRAPFLVEERSTNGIDATPNQPSGRPVTFATEAALHLVALKRGGHSVAHDATCNSAFPPRQQCRRNTRRVAAAGAAPCRARLRSGPELRRADGRRRRPRHRRSVFRAGRFRALRARRSSELRAGAARLVAEAPAASEDPGDRSCRRLCRQHHRRDRVRCRRPACAACGQPAQLPTNDQHEASVAAIDGAGQRGRRAGDGDHPRAQPGTGGAETLRLSRHRWAAGRLCIGAAHPDPGHA